MTAGAEFGAAGAAALALWLLAFGAALLATRNGTVQAGPATQELGDSPEPPAVVSLLANGWRSVDHAAESTLLDLAARGHLELRQAGEHPADTTVHLTSDAPTMLRPYEHRVLARVTAQAGSDGAPIGAIAFRAPKQAATWNRLLRQEIVAEARQRGLSRARFGSALGTALMAAAVAPAVLFGLAVLTIGGTHGVRGALLAGAVTFTVLTFLLSTAIGERATPAGLDRAAHWAGVRSWLHAHETFTQLPPAAVTVWERYLAYGAALDVTVRINQLLDFGTGNPRRVWSGYGGTWREVRIRYPRVWPGLGARDRGLLQRALAAAVVAVGLGVFAALRQPSWVSGGLLDTDHAVLTLGWMVTAMLGSAVAGRFNRLTAGLAFFAGAVANALVGDDLGRRALDGSGPLLGEWVAIGLFGAVAGLYVAMAVLDRAAGLTITGEVLRIESRRSEKWPHFLAVDDGTGDRTTAWALPGIPSGFATGSTVRLTVTPATRRVRVVQVLALGADYKAQLREPSSTIS
ncbi:hypothetical protein P3T37_001262 [Kitasatospora sp. MAA4]|uniref:DUF2207 family protein n=1 Tax=Kitasatospora sp. MAA4 TaxID=3035093 RepID=UPI0024735477|nr:DUF2207 domain-containing protein [Kitasatospora sp. MAA4]MDH6131888.1 hypothetical protein [Kitasatospora sp. MAA4]